MCFMWNGIQFDNVLYTKQWQSLVQVARWCKLSHDTVL